MASLDPRIHTSFAHLKQLQGKAKSIRFLGRQQAKSILSGRHASRIRGRGLSFEELRDYRAGDDIRTIDWRVTARTGKPHIRVYTEEKDKAAILIVDQRLSMFFGSVHNMKSVTASEIASLIAYSLFAQGDRIGGVLFNDHTVANFKPSKQPASLEYFIKQISAFNCLLHVDQIYKNPAMHLNQPLKAANRLVSHDQLIFVISDFSEVDEQTHQYLAQMARHNTVILCLITDSLTQTLPKNVSINVSDGISQMQLNTHNKKVHRELISTFTKRVEQIKGWQSESNLTVIPFCASEDTFEQLKAALGT